MLRITINGDSLDLSEDISIPIIYENPLFSNERIPVTKSLNFTLPQTSNNLKLLSYPNRINKTTHKKEFTNVIIRFQSIKLLEGIITLQEIGTAIKVAFKTYGLLDLMKSPIDGDFYKVQLADSNDSTYSNFMKDCLDENEDLRLAPVRNIQYSWKDDWPENTLYDYPSDDGEKAAELMYFNFYNILNSEFYLSGSFNYPSYCYPAPPVWFLLSEIFGSSLISNPFDSGLLRKLIINGFFQDHELVPYTLKKVWNEVTSNYDYFIAPGMYQSSMPLGDIIKSLAKIFCQSVFIKNNKLSILLNKSLVLDASMKKAPKLIGELTHWKENRKTYRYGYSDYSDENLDFHISRYSTEQSIEDIFNLTPASNGSTKYISDTNQVITKKEISKDDPGEPDRFDYEVLITGFESNEILQNENETFEAISDLSPLVNNVHPFWTDDKDVVDGIDFGYWYVPEVALDREIRQQKPFLAINWGIKDALTSSWAQDGVVIGQVLYPYWSGHNYDAHGNRLGDLSLQWEGVDGLIANYHQEFKDWIESDKIKAKGIFLMTPLEISNLDLSKKHSLKNKNWFFEKVEITFRYNKIDAARIHLVEAPDVSNGSGSSGGGL